MKLTRKVAMAWLMKQPEAYLSFDANRPTQCRWFAAMTPSRASPMYSGEGPTSTRAVIELRRAMRKDGVKL